MKPKSARKRNKVLCHYLKSDTKKFHTTCHFLELKVNPKNDKGLLFWKIAEICLKTLTKIPKIPKTAKKVLTSLCKHKKK